MKPLLIVISAISVLSLTACPDPATDTATEAGYQPRFDGDAVKAHVALLGGDLYEGREAGSRGYELAAEYVSTQFKVLGLTPGNGDSYYQKVPFIASHIVPGTRALNVTSEKGETSFETYTEFTSNARLGGDEVSVTAPLVFVGYGVNAPLVERNDYEGVDLEGKIAVVVNGAPEALGSEKRAFYRSTRYHKFVELEKRGAVGVIGLQHRQISSEGAAVRGSKTRKFWWTDEHDHPKHAFEDIGFESFMLETGARKLFENSPVSFDEMAAQIEAEDYTPFEMGMSATISHQQKQSVTDSKNVVGILEGSDPELRDEYVILSAHLDGVGMGPDGEDRIYNGFYDNASGIGVMIEVARALVNSPDRPRRSIIFLATTGEEKGLLGADFFANNPTVPVESIVADVNMDMAIFLWRLQDVVAFGAQHSTMAETVARAVEKAGVEVSPDPFPERGYFTRSDQFPFVQQGVPAVFLATGFKTPEDGVDPEALYNNFMQTHYHGPTDDQNLRFDTWSAAKVAEVNYYISLEIANADDRPRWKKDDFFGDMYGTDSTRPR